MPEQLPKTNRTYKTNSPAVAGILPRRTVTKTFFPSGKLALCMKAPCALPEKHYSMKRSRDCDHMITAAPLRASRTSSKEAKPEENYKETELKLTNVARGHCLRNFLKTAVIFSARAATLYGTKIPSGALFVDASAPTPMCPMTPKVLLVLY